MCTSWPMNIALPVWAHEAGVVQQSPAVATLCSAVTVRCGSAETGGGAGISPI